MSLKATAFALCLPVPKTVEKFYISFQGNAKSLVRVSAASLPYPKYGEGVIWLWGRPLFVPISKEVDGEWSCIYEEDLAMTGAMNITSLQKKYMGVNQKFTNINIYVTDQLTGELPMLCVTLKYAYLTRVDPVDLDWSKPEQPIKYRLAFRYSGFKRWF